MMNLRVTVSFQTLRSPRVRPRALHSACFFSPLAPPRYFPSRSLRLSRSPPYSPPLSLRPRGHRLGGAARPPPASLSPLHIAAPHAYSSLPSSSPSPFSLLHGRRRGRRGGRGPSAPWPAAGEGRRGGPHLLHGWRRGGEARRSGGKEGRGGVAWRRQGREARRRASGVEGRRRRYNFFLFSFLLQVFYKNFFS